MNGECDRINPQEYNDAPSAAEFWISMKANCSIIGHNMANIFIKKSGMQLKMENGKLNINVSIVQIFQLPSSCTNILESALSLSSQTWEDFYNSYKKLNR